MRTVKFKVDGHEIEGYFVGISNAVRGTGNYSSHSVLLVENKEGDVFSVTEDDVKFTSPPENLTPIKRIDLRLMRNALITLGGTYTLEDLIKLAKEQNIIIGDSEGI